MAIELHAYRRLAVKGLVFFFFNNCYILYWYESLPPFILEQKPINPNLSPNPNQNLTQAHTQTLNLTQTHTHTPMMVELGLWLWYCSGW